MSFINRLYTFATLPGISPDVGAKIDAEINQILNLVNGSLDDVNIDGSPPIQGYKLSVATAPQSGGTFTDTVLHLFSGIWRRMGATNGLVREYNSGSNVWGISYNTFPDSNGNWSGRDASDVCLRMEFTTTIGPYWGGVRFYLAPQAGVSVTPVWFPVQHHAPMGGYTRFHNGTSWSSEFSSASEELSGSPSLSGIFHYNRLIINGTWTLEQGKPLIIFARESVTINGTIDGNGKGRLSGAGSNNYGNPGAQGECGAGGGGGGGGTGGGGDGGKTLYLGEEGIGAGGGVGGSGGNGSSLNNQRRAYFEVGVLGGGGGGGGGGGTGVIVGGNGGNGGGAIVIIAPIITIGSAGIIRANGVIGNNAAGTSRGAGGGGGGGLIYMQAKSCNLITGCTITATGASGGTSGGSGSGAGGTGGAGVVYIEELK